jgi:hypothetical protein
MLAEIVLVLVSAVGLAIVLMSDHEIESGDYTLMRDGEIQFLGISERACTDLIEMHMGMDPVIAAQLKCLRTAHH